MPRSFDDFDFHQLPAAGRLMLAQDPLDSVIAEGYAEPLTARQLAEIERLDDAIDAG